MARREAGVASAVWALVTEVGRDEHIRGQFRSRAMSLGPMLLGSGLAATAAVLKAKSHGNNPLERAYGRVLEGMTRHVFTSLGTDRPGADLVTWLMSNPDHIAYRRASAAASDYALWLRRAAEAIIPRAEGEQ